MFGINVCFIVVGGRMVSISLPGLENCPYGGVTVQVAKRGVFPFSLSDQIMCLMLCEGGVSE